MAHNPVLSYEYIDKYELVELACVIIPSLPLQIFAAKDPEVRARPAVIVEAERPQAEVLWTNRKARLIGILPGMRYGSALAVHGELRAGVISPAEVQGAVDALVKALHQESPRVEANTQEPGVFWLDMKGLSGIFGSMSRWAQGVRSHLQALGWESSVALGWQRMAVYAIARHFRGIRIATTRQQEQQLLGRVQFNSLGNAMGSLKGIQAALAHLGIETIADFLALQPDALRERHGAEALQVWRHLNGDIAESLRNVEELAPPSAFLDLEPPDDQADRLSFVARQLLVQLLRQVAIRNQAVAELLLELKLEHYHGIDSVDTNADTAQFSRVAQVLSERLQPAEPTLQEALLVDLLRLRIENIRLTAKVESVRLTLHTVAAQAWQLRLWQLSGRRDLQSATLALTRMRAAFGDKSIVYAELRSAHLPEASYCWQPLERMVAAQSSGPASPPLLVRRVHKVKLLQAHLRSEPDGRMLHDGQLGRSLRQWGPFRLTGGWWFREIRREYHMVEAEAGDLLWVYWDVVRRQWYQQGAVD